MLTTEDKTYLHETFLLKEEYHATAVSKADFEIAFDYLVKHMATKEDIADLRSELRAEMSTGFSDIRAEMATKEDLNQVNIRIDGLTGAIQDLQTDRP